MVSPTVERLEKAIFAGDGVGGGEKKVAARGRKGGEPGDAKAVVFELDADDLAVVPDPTSSFSYVKQGQGNGGPAYRLSGDDVRVRPKRVHRVELGGTDDDASVVGDTMDGTEPGSGRPEGIVAMGELLVRAWQATEATEAGDESPDAPGGEERLLVHDVARTDPVTGRERRVRCEATVTRLDEWSVLVVVRDVSDRFRRFRAQKLVLMERTARVKDAEANRFTKHEVKNGLLNVIGLCDQLRDSAATSAPTLPSLAAFDFGQCVGELDLALHEVLDTVLAQAMARDVMHGSYKPKIERLDVAAALYGARGGRRDPADDARFPLVTRPSPLPPFMLDPQLLRFVHKNAISNASKYGKRGGRVVTEVSYEGGEVTMKVINLPGQFHGALVRMGDSAGKAVFEPGKRLHPDLGKDLGSEQQHNGHGKKQSETHSSGDGAWIMKKCAKTLGGDCSISFEESRTVFSLRFPAKAGTRA